MAKTDSAKTDVRREDLLSSVRITIRGVTITSHLIQLRAFIWETEQALRRSLGRGSQR